MAITVRHDPGLATSPGVWHKTGVAGAGRRVLLFVARAVFANSGARQKGNDRAQLPLPLQLELRITEYSARCVVIATQLRSGLRRIVP